MLRFRIVVLLCTSLIAFPACGLLPTAVAPGGPTCATPFVTSGQTYSLTCPSGFVCTNDASNDFGCCPTPTQNPSITQSACIVPTACVESGDLAIYFNTFSTSFDNPYVLFCTKSYAPFCATFYFSDLGRSRICAGSDFSEDVTAVHGLTLATWTPTDTFSFETFPTETSAPSNTSTPYSVQSPSSSNLSPGAIAGIVIGCATGLSIFALLILWLYIDSKRTMSSKIAIRVKDIPEDTTFDVVKKFAEDQISSCRSGGGIFKRKPKKDEEGGNTKPNIKDFTLAPLASQLDKSAATISFQEADIKDYIMKHKTAVPDWEIDDDFLGMTVLCSPEDADLDICAIHGLNGNAFDTWMGKKKMWLRDILPLNPQFRKSRILTYGYNANLFNSRSTSGVRQWAINLLDQLGHLRSSTEEQARPLIFVCHSMGGLVGRQIAVRLGSHGDENVNIPLELCGFLFISTPHFGSEEADRSDALVGVAEYAFGLRGKAIVGSLRTFNDDGVASKDNFRKLKPVPPFWCLYEENDTHILGKNRRIVTQDSASLLGQTAEPVANVDHTTIVKWDRADGGYLTILERLRRLRTSLFERSQARSGYRVGTQLQPNSTDNSQPARINAEGILQPVLENSEDTWEQPGNAEVPSPVE